jgi:UDP-glucose 4-epimerase
MNYLITGGCGFIGSHIARQLKKQGHNPICYDLHPNKTSIQHVFVPEELCQITIIEGDVNDRETLIKVIEENKIDIMLHLAGLLATDSEADPATAVRVNIQGTINVFEAAIVCGIKRVVWASSQSIFGTEEMYRELYHTNLVPNYALPKPKLLYGATKAFNEFLGEWYYDNYGLETIGLRYTMVFGIARMRGIGQYATNLINKPAEGVKGIVENSETVPNWIYVEDAARATILASQCPNPKTRNFTIGGETKSIREMRQFVLNLLPDAEIDLLPGKISSCYNLDLSAAEEELGYKYEYSATDGARTTINLIRSKRGLPPV